MKQSAGEFYNNLKGKRAAFIGAGVSHRECIEVFAKKGAIVTLCDKKPDVNAFGAYGETLKQLGVRLSLGEHYLDGLAGQAAYSVKKSRSAKRQMFSIKTSVSNWPDSSR